MAGSGAKWYNPISWGADLYEASQGRKSNIVDFSKDLKQAGADISGKTARDKANEAARQQEEYQAGVEKKLYDKTVLDAATLDMQKKRQAQKASAAKASGRSGTILTSGLGQMDSGKKVLLGE